MLNHVLREKLWDTLEQMLEQVYRGIVNLEGSKSSIIILIVRSQWVTCGKVKKCKWKQLLYQVYI